MADFSKLKADLYYSLSDNSKATKRTIRFKAKTWCQEYHWLRKAFGLLSWIIQILAIAAAFYGAQLLAMKGFENASAVVIVATTFLVILELLQRHSSDKLWDKYWSSYQWSTIWISLSIALFLITGSIGVYGTYSSVTHLADAPTLITNDSILNALEAEEAILKKEIASIEKQTDSKGIIFYKIQDEYSEKLASRTTIADKILKRKEAIEANNKIAEIRSADDVRTDAKMLVLIFIALGFLFELCMCFNSYYDFREECEENEDNPEMFLKQIGVKELHPIIAKKYPEIAAKLSPRRVGFQTPQATANPSGFLKNYTPPTAKASPPPITQKTPPPQTVATPVSPVFPVATTGTAATTQSIATDAATARKTKIVVVEDPEKELAAIYKRLGPVNANLNNPKRKNTTDSNFAKARFEEAEKLDWDNVGEDMLTKYATRKNKIVSNPNFIS